MPSQDVENTILFTSNKIYLFQADVSVKKNIKHLL